MGERGVGGRVSWHVRVVRNRYADSVRLMSIARTVRGREGVNRCELTMGTAANLEVLAQAGAVAEASPADLVIAVDARDGVAEGALAARRSTRRRRRGARTAPLARARSHRARRRQRRDHLGARRVRRT
jgi:hypothetical protein